MKKAMASLFVCGFLSGVGVMTIAVEGDLQRLTLSSQPEVGLEIYIDGVTKGLRTPQTLSLPVGIHKVRLVVPRFKTEPVWSTHYADGTASDFMLKEYGHTNVSEDVEQGSTIQYNATDVVLFSKYSVKTTNTPGKKMRAQTNLAWHWLPKWVPNKLEIKESLITVWAYVKGKPGPEPNWISLITVVFDAGWDHGDQVATTDIHTKDMRIREWFWADSEKFSRQPVADAPPYPLDKWVKVSLYTQLDGTNSHVMVFQDDDPVVDAKGIPFRPANKRPDFMHWGGYGSEGNGPLTIWNSRTSVERVIGPGPTFSFSRWEQDGKTIAGKVPSVEINLTADTHLCAQGDEKEFFGAEGNPTGDPIGGGAGYRRVVARGDYTVRTYEELRDALAKVRAGQIVYLDDSAKIDLTDREGLVIPAGVTLASGRGQKDSPGALIYTRQLQTFKEQNYANLVLFLTGGEGVRITGLRLRGPDPELRTQQMEQWYKEGRYYTLQNSDGIRCGHAKLEVDNCELSGWSHAAIYLMPGATKAHIHHNDIHHNQREGLGYGVCMDKVEALIEANIFSACRHAIASTGALGSGYEACYNIVKAEDGNGHSFDMHGGKDRKDNTDIAGDSINIHHNTFEATKVWAVVIRGRPAKKAEIHHNWFLHPDPKKIVLQSNSTGNMEVYRNRYGPSKLPMQTEEFRRD